MFSRSKEIKDIGLPSFDLRMLKEPLSPIHNKQAEETPKKRNEGSTIECEFDESQLKNNEMIFRSELMQFKLIFDLSFKIIFNKLEAMVNEEISKIILEGFHLEEYLGCMR